MKKKAALVCLAALLMVVSLQPVLAAQNDIRVVVDGRNVLFSAQVPHSRDGRLVFPLRDVFAALGFNVDWNEQNQQSTVVNGDFRIVLTIGSDAYTINGVMHFMNPSPVMVDGTVMVPIIPLLVNTGHMVHWDSNGNTLFVTSPLGRPQPVVTPPVILYPVPLQQPAHIAHPINHVYTVAGTGVHGVEAFLNHIRFNLPGSIASAPDGNLLIADTFNNLIRTLITDPDVRVVDLIGNVQIAAGDNFPLGFFVDGSFLNAGLNRPSGVAVCEDGYIFIADSENHAIRVGIDGELLTFVGGLGAGHRDGSPHEAQFNSPQAIAICPRGDLIVADTHNHVIRRISRNGRVQTIAGFPGRPGYAEGRGANARFDSPAGVAVHPDGRIFVADTGNNVIRVIEGSLVTTIAGSVVRRADRDGHDDGWDMLPLGDFLDGFGTDARFNAPVGMAIWNDNLVIADSANHSIRVLLANGFVVTVAGTGEPGYFENGVPHLHLPRDVYIRGNFLYIADTGNNMIRRMRLQ